MIVARVDETGDAVAQQLGAGMRGGDLDVLALHRRLVRVHAVEQEGLRIGLVGEPAREVERRVEMAVDHAGGRDGAARIEGLRIGMRLNDRVRLADRNDPALGDRHARILDDAPRLVDRDEPADVADDEVGFFRFR